MMSLAAIALGLFAVKTGKTLLLYPFRVQSGFKGAFYASFAGLALSHTVGKAVWSGLLTSEKPFLRTPKCGERRPASAGAAAGVRGVVPVGPRLGGDRRDVVDARLRGPAAIVWMATLFVQSIPFVATLVMATISGDGSHGPAVLAQPALPSSPAGIAAGQAAQ